MNSDDVLSSNCSELFVSNAGVVQESLYAFPAHPTIAIHGNNCRRCKDDTSW